MKSFASVFMLSIVLCVVGCGGPEKIPMTLQFVSVEGNVTASGGKPLKYGVLTFEPEPGQTARTELVAFNEGQFKLKMVPGKYKVIIDSRAASKSGIASKYQSPKTTDLVVEVSQANPSLTINFK